MPKKPPEQLSGDIAGRYAPQVTLTALVESGKLPFLDMVAAQLFVAGWPVHDIYTRAERLWELRSAYIEGKRK